MNPILTSNNGNKGTLTLLTNERSMADKSVSNVIFARPARSRCARTKANVVNAPWSKASLRLHLAVMHGKGLGTALIETVCGCTKVFITFS